MRVSTAVCGSTESPAAVKIYCRTWIAACATEDGSRRDRALAGDSQRWGRLRHMYPLAPTRERHTDVSADCWNILHILPYVVWSWSSSPWARNSASQYMQLYAVHPDLQHLCEQIADKSEWGGAISLPCGLTWDDRIASIGQTLRDAQPRLRFSAAAVVENLGCNMDCTYNGS